SPVTYGLADRHRTVTFKQFGCNSHNTQTQRKTHKWQIPLSKIVFRPAALFTLLLEFLTRRWFQETRRTLKTSALVMLMLASMGASFTFEAMSISRRMPRALSRSACKSRSVPTLAARFSDGASQTRSASALRLSELLPLL